MVNKKSLSINIDIEVDGDFIICKTGHLTRAIIGTSDIGKWNIQFDEETGVYLIPISSLDKRKKQLIEKKNSIDDYLKNINQILEQITDKHD